MPLQNIFKHISPEWKKSPVLAQIREALREVEHVRNALLAMEHHASVSDAMHNVALQSRGLAANAAALGALGLPGAKNMATTHNNIANSMGGASVALAHQEMQRLDGWMKSLTESEMGLRVLLAPHDSGQAAKNFAKDRSTFLDEQATKWASMRQSLTL